MHYRQTTATLRQTFATAERLGATIPKPVLTQYRSLAKLDAKVQNLNPTGPSFAAATLEALEADRDPVTDPAVQAALVGQAINQQRGAVQDLLAARASALIDEHAEAILASFAKPFDNAAATLVDAHTQLDGIDIDGSAEAVLHRGGDAAKVWVDARQANAVIGEIRQEWKLLANHSSRLKVDPRHVTLMIADIPADRYVREGIRGTLTPWQVLQHGFTLSLATPATLAERIASVQGEVTQLQAERESASQQAFHRAHGFGAAVH